MTIKNWFMDKEFSGEERYAISATDEPTIDRETEKAILLVWKTDFGQIRRWVPKSCILTDEQEAAIIAELNTPEKIAARKAAIDARDASYEALITKCKEHGIPARKGWKASTMKSRLLAAGVVE